jgi:hypothetical protein
VAKGGAGMTKKIRIRWFKEPQKEDYPSAESYLSLLMDGQDANDIVDRLMHADPAEFAAKDIFRASELALLGAGNSHVEKDRAVIGKGGKLSPLLLYRDPQRRKLVIADGYHRLCAVYTYDEDAVIPCRIV